MRNRDKHRRLTHLAIELTRQMAERQLTCLAISKETGIAVGTQSRILRGVQSTVKQDYLDKIVPAIAGTDETNRARIIAAHMADYRFGPGSELIEIRIRGKAIEHRDPGSEWEAALEYLTKQAKKNRDVADMLILMARTAGMEAPVDAQGKTRPPMQPVFKSKGREKTEKTAAA